MSERPEELVDCSEAATEDPDAPPEPLDPDTERQLEAEHETGHR